MRRQKRLIGLFYCFKQVIPSIFEVSLKLKWDLKYAFKVRGIFINDCFN